MCIAVAGMLIKHPPPLCHKILQTVPHHLARSQHKLMFTEEIKLWHQIFFTQEGRESK